MNIYKIKSTYKSENTVVIKGINKPKKKNERLEANLTT